MVLRKLAGQECFERNRHKFVMGAMFVAETTCLVLYSLAQKHTRPVFWDTFMKIQILTFAVAAAKQYQFQSTHGLFISGMCECFMEQMGFQQQPEDQEL